MNESPSEDTSSIVWAPSMDQAAPASSSLSQDSPPIFVNDSFELKRRGRFECHAPGLRAFNQGIQRTSSLGPDSLPDLLSSASSGISSIVPPQPSGDASVHQYPSMDKTEDIFTDAHLTRIRRRRRSSAPGRVSFYSPPARSPMRPSRLQGRLIPLAEVSMSEPYSTSSTDRGVLNPPSDVPSIPSGLQRAVSALQACMDQPARQNLPCDTLWSVSRWLMLGDWPSDLRNVHPVHLEGASANPIVISDDSSAGATRIFQADSEIEFRCRAPR